jgi:hypothetical protein
MVEERLTRLVDPLNDAEVPPATMVVAPSVTFVGVALLLPEEDRIGVVPKAWVSFHQWVGDIEFIVDSRKPF